MFTRITSRASALITAIVMLTGGAILQGGAAAADPNQDEQFLAMLEKEEIPAVGNVPSLIATAHQVCRKLDGGAPVDTLVDAMRNDAYKTSPILRRVPPARVTSTMTRFITAAVETYCPYDQSKIASITANPAPGSTEPMHRVAAYTRTAVDGGNGLQGPPPNIVVASLIGAAPSGEITPPDPPEIPAPPPPTAQIVTPPRPIAAPPAPKQLPPPPPQQAEPPAVAPQPGGGAGSGGSGSTGGNGGGGPGGDGGDGPAEPSPTPPMAPGWVRLAP